MSNFEEIHCTGEDKSVEAYSFSTTFAMASRWLLQRIRRNRQSTPELDQVRASGNESLAAYYLAQDLGFSSEDALSIASNPEERRLFLSKPLRNS